MKQIYMNLKRSILELLIIASIILIPSSVSGQYTLTDADVEVIDGVIFNYKYSGSGHAPTDIIIPGVLDGQAVTSIMNNAFCGGRLAGAAVPNSVTSIGYDAFSDTYIDSSVLP